MNQLPNAPLIEVNYKIRWHIRNANEMENMQYFLGDYYNSIKDKFPNRQKIEGSNLPIQANFNSFSHRFTLNGVNYPNIQIGANVFSLTSTDEYYYWEDFFQKIEYACSNLINTLKELINPDHYHLYLEYIDFYEFNFEEANVFEFLNKKLKINVKQNFFETDNTVQNFETSFDYKTDIGDFTCTLQRGRFNEKDGVIVIIETESDIVPPEIDEILKWSNAAHDTCKKAFLKMTEGELYNTFLN